MFLVLFWLWCLASAGLLLLVVSGCCFDVTFVPAFWGCLFLLCLFPPSSRFDKEKDQEGERGGVADQPVKACQSPFPAQSIPKKDAHKQKFNNPTQPN